MAVERWQNLTGGAAVLEGDGRSFAEIAGERSGALPANATLSPSGLDPQPKPSRKRKSTA